MIQPQHTQERVLSDPSDGEIVTDLFTWIKTVLEAPRTILGKYPICPFAKEARLQQRVQIHINRSPNLEDFILNALPQLVDPIEVQIFVELNLQCWSPQAIDRFCEDLNEQLAPQDVILLADHPHDPGMIGDVITSNGQYLLILAQQRSLLSKAHEQLAQTDYYQAWTSAYYEKIVLNPYRSP